MQLLILALVLLSGITFAANREQASGKATTWLPYLLYLLVGIMAYLGLNVFSLGFAGSISPEQAEELGIALPNINPIMGTIFFIFSLLMATLGFFLVRRQKVRIRFQLLIGEQTGYNPDSVVHTTALIMILLTLVASASIFMLSGGVDGFAEDLATSEAEGSSTNLELVITLIAYVVISVLGVGFGLRRNLGETLERLGLEMPQARDVYWGVGVAVLLYIIVLVLGSIWALMVSPEVFEEQTAASEAIFALYSGSLLTGFLLALSAGVGEEIFFRGALQPIFGIAFTTFYFVILHLQYTLTPASLIIAVVAVAMAWLRQRFNTTTAIIAHFVYNFIPFILVTLADTLTNGAV